MKGKGKRRRPQNKIAKKHRSLFESAFYQVNLNVAHWSLGALILQSLIGWMSMSRPSVLVLDTLTWAIRYESTNALPSSTPISPPLCPSISIPSQYTSQQTGTMHSSWSWSRGYSHKIVVLSNKPSGFASTTVSRARMLEHFGNVGARSQAFITCKYTRVSRLRHVVLCAY